MQHEMSTLQTIIMVTKNIAGMAIVACFGVCRKNYVKMIIVGAVVSALYLIS
jgi:hypothetical protein